MNWKHARNFLATLAVVTLLASLAVSQSDDQTFHWSGKLAAENIVEIKNLNGRIDATSTTGDTVEVTAEKSGPQADKVKIVTVPSSEGITICAIYPESDASRCQPGAEWNTSGMKGDRTKVDFHVRLPGNLRFAAQSTNGSVTAEDMGRFVRAITVNGGVRVSTKSWAELKSVNGSIEATMGSANWTGTLEIKTVNGSVDLTLPSDMNADVRFRSVNGRLDSSFPVTVQGGFGRRSLEGRIGNGGRDLVVETVNGSVNLRKGTM